MKILLLMTFLTPLIMCNVKCQAQSMEPGSKNYKFLSADKTGIVPFESKSNHIVISATINGKAKVRLILDTGMPMGGLMLIGKEKKDEWGLTFTSEMQIPGGSGSDPSLSAGVAEGVKIDFPGLELTDLTVIVEPTNGNIGKMLTDVDGIIGYELFSKFAVTIDNDKNNIVLMESDTFRIPEGAETLPLILKNNFPWLACSAEMANGAVVPLEMVVDIGAAHNLSLNVGTHENIIPPDNAIETLIGETMSGKIYGKVGRIKSLHFGKFALNNVMTTFQTGPRRGPSAMEKHGNLGHGALQRFNVTFDYNNERMILTPSSHFNEPFEYNMSGIEYRKTPDGKLKIEQIIVGSPSDKTELRAGDIISTINGKQAGSMSKDELWTIFRQEGAKVQITVLSPDGKTKDVMLTLRRVI